MGRHKAEDVEKEGSSGRRSASHLSSLPHRVQVQITSDAQWREVLKEPGCFFLEIYSEKWGQCACFKGTVQKMFYEHMGWCKFYAAPVEKVKALIEHDCVEPVFAVYVE